MASRVFGTLPDGSAIDEVAIAAGNLSASVITYGAAIRDIRLAGIDHPLVLGFDRVDDYVRHSPHFGAVVGRVANRIGGGRFSIDGQRFQLSLNLHGRQHIHGGHRGFSRRAWRLADHTGDSVTLAIVSPDSEEGYPGTVAATVRYVVAEPATIRMEAVATTDAPTLVNLAQHSYFNLDDSPNVLDHHIEIFADSYTPTDADDVPTGEILSVAGSDFDFRTARPLRQMRGGGRVGFNKNFVIARRKSARPLAHARVFSPRNGVVLEVASTEPGIQFYDGVFMNIPVPGLGGRRYAVNAGCCFEPQLFPDAINHPGFPSPILRPGETYRQVTTFSFSRH